MQIIIELKVFLLERSKRNETIFISNSFQIIFCKIILNLQKITLGQGYNVAQIHYLGTSIIC